MKFVLFVVSSLFALSAYTQNYKVGDVATLNSTSELRPTQMGVGIQASQEMMEFKYIKAYCKANNISFVKGGGLEANLKNLKAANKLDDFIGYINEEMKKKPFPGAIATDGKTFYHWDGHHRSRGIFEVNQVIEKISPETKNFVRPSVTIQYDFTGLTEKQAADKIIFELKKGYVLPKVRAQILADANPDDAFQMKKMWAESVETITDYPARSLAGKFLLNEGIDSGKFVDYIEYLLLEQMPEKYSNIKPGTVITDAMIKDIEKAFFTNPKIVEKFSENARDAATALAVKTEVELKHFEFRKANKISVPLSPYQKDLHLILGSLESINICGP